MVWHKQGLALQSRNTISHVGNFSLCQRLCRCCCASDQVSRRLLQFFPPGHRHRAVKATPWCRSVTFHLLRLTHRFRTTSGPMSAIAPCSSSECPESHRRSRCHRFLIPPPKGPYRPQNAPAAPTRAAGLAAALTGMKKPPSWCTKAVRWWKSM